MANTASSAIQTAASPCRAPEKYPAPIAAMSAAIQIARCIHRPKTAVSNSRNGRYVLMLKRGLTPLLDGDGLREVAGLVDVGALEDGDVIREQLQWHGVHRRCLEVAHVLRHLDHGHAVRRDEA